MNNDNQHKTVCFTGHRPRSLPWGYNEKNELCCKFRAILKQEIENLIIDGYNYFISGMAIGVDIIAAELVLELKSKYKHIKLEGAVPCPQQDSVWDNSQKVRYRNVLKQCDFVHTISPQYSSSCMNDRNHYMIEKSDLVIAVWNGKPSGTGNTIKMAQKKGCRLIIIDPNKLNEFKSANYVDAETIDFLKRQTARNSKDYNPITDKFLLDDAIKEIRLKTQIVLNNSERTELAILLMGDENYKKIIKKFTKKVQKSRKIMKN